ncbi:MAG: DNA recombination protein RmuC [Bacteroidales bacterium]|nr:DNA recombination protein RmuC [Bacteroidales bacterium]
MDTTLLVIIAIILITNTLLILLRKNKNKDLEDLNNQINNLRTEISRQERIIREEFMNSRQENRSNDSENRMEANAQFKLMGESLSHSIDGLAQSQKIQLTLFSNRLKELYQLFENSSKLNRDEISKVMNDIRETLENNLKQIREENTTKLNEIKILVDDKLKETLEKRFNDSFKLISDRLEQVHKGLGEMQTLATGVGDLKKVLSNVKTRGNLGEVQLEAILSQILSPEQYIVNAAVTSNTQQRVEFAVKLPGNDPDGKPILLPIDSKFPTEDYQRLCDAYETGRDIEREGARFEAAVKKNAEDILKKYILPPTTTDFAIMFVPTEGLYAEILRRPGLFETLRREYKITVTGPANLAAFLSSLQMGFRTLAIEKRSSEVWKLLSEVKTEFTTFGDILDKTKKKLAEAANVIDTAGVRSRAIERKLRDVESDRMLQ